MPILLLAATLAHAHDYHDLRTEDGTLRYALVLPPNHDPSIPTPVLKVLPGEGHVPPSLDGDVMMKHLERQRQRTLAARTLDAFHDAASRADGAAYFELMTDDASFIGTDATEHWNRDDFRDFAMPYFERGTGWTYVPRGRRLRLAPDATTAWFDEQLDNEKYGRCRGTGLLRRTPDGWRIVQYALSIPIPDAVAPEVVDRIRSVAGTDGTE